MHMEMPQVLDQHRKLQALAGNWTGDETIHPSPWDPKGGKATGKISARIEMDGFFLVSDYTEERGGQVAYRGHGVFGYDAQEQCYTMHWFDSIGSPCSSPARGRWEGDKLAFEQRNPMGHSRYTYTMEGEGRYRFLIENSQDGKVWRPFMEGAYTRK